MKPFSPVLTLLFIGFLLLIAANLSSGGTELTGVDIFNSAPFDCDETAKIRHDAQWVNDIGTIRIYNAKLWMGASVDAVADVGMITYLGNHSVLFHENWDRYANPTGFHVSTLDLSPNYILVNKGETVHFYYWCHNFDGLKSRAHAIITIWYAR